MRWVLASGGDRAKRSVRSVTRIATFFEDELARELAPHHALYTRRCTAVAQTGASDDVLFRLDNGTFAQVHLTFTQNPPERPGWPGYDVFKTLADWMIERMLPDHTDHFALWDHGS